MTNATKIKQYHQKAGRKQFDKNRESDKGPSQANVPSRATPLALFHVLQTPGSALAGADDGYAGDDGPRPGGLQRPHGHPGRQARGRGEELER